MPLTDVYVASTDDPVLVEGREGLPAGLGPGFPPCGGQPFLLVLRRIKEGTYRGRQVDWGAWCAEVSKGQILDLVRECYEGDRTYLDPEYLPHLYPLMAPFLEFIRGLDDQATYALIAFET